MRDDKDHNERLDDFSGYMRQRLEEHRLPVDAGCWDEVEARMKILVEPKNSLVKQYKKLFELDGVQLDFKEDALEAIAKKSLERKTGARGLRAIMEDTMMDLMYEIPSDNTTKECVITKDAVEKKAEPEIIHGEPAPVPRRNMGRRSGRPETA